MKHLKMKHLKWRHNLHKILILWNDKIWTSPNSHYKTSGLPPIIIDCIDAAYIQGIEESKASAIRAENKEWREGRRCNICGKPKDSNLTDMCGKCLENN